LHGFIVVFFFIGPYHDPTELSLEDTAEYTCKVTSPTGETSMASSLEVFPSSSYNAQLRAKISRMAGSTPGPPGVPTIEDVSKSGVRLAWESSQGSREGDFLGKNALQLKNKIKIKG
jgi:hypothetical protein